jgi:urease gamma subunit
VPKPARRIAQRRKEADGHRHIQGVGSMHLTIREEERIQIWAAAEMARRRLERGVPLNYPEAVAVICDEILERAREGSIPMLTDMMEYGATILKRKDVMTGVPDMMKIIQVEALFPDGTKLVTVMNPIRS